jgi:hypothetical protein
VVGATMLAVGGAMTVVGVLDAAGVVRLLGGSSLFLGLCGVLGGTLLVLVARSESTGDEDEPGGAGAGARVDADGVRRVAPDPEDFFDTEAPFGPAGRVGPRGAAASVRARPASSAPPAAPTVTAPPPAARPPASRPPATAPGDPPLPPFPGALPAVRRRRR